jgi:hypothetical protein
MLHHDDWFTSRDSLASFVELLEANGAAGLGFSASEGVDSGSGRVISRNVPAPETLQRLGADRSALLNGNVIGAPSATIYRREGAPPFDERLHWLVDIDFYIRILAANPVVAYDARPLIRTTTGALHQVTHSVIADPKVDVVEWLYLLDKHRRSTSSVRLEAAVVASLIERHGRQLVLAAVRAHSSWRLRLLVELLARRN